MQLKPYRAETGFAQNVLISAVPLLQVGSPPKSLLRFQAQTRPRRRGEGGG